MTFREFERRLFLWTMKGLLVLAVFVVSVYFGLWGYTAYREWRLGREWAETVGSLVAFEGAFVREGKNQAAQQVEELLVPAGIAFFSDRSPSGWKATPWTDAERHVRAYVERELENPDAAVGRPPEEVEGFLTSFRPTLDLVRARLLATPGPLWAQDPARMWGDPAPPNHLGFVHLAEWLMADGLSGIAEGDPGRAALDLEASRVLVGGIALRLELPSQAAAVVLQDFQVGFLRKLDPAPPHWKARLGDIFGGAALRRAFAFEAYIFLERGRQVARVPFYRKMARRERLFWRTFGRLWYRLNMVDVAQRYLEEMRLLESLGPCAYDYKGPAHGIAGSLPWWNTMGRVGLMNLGYFWERGMKLEVDAELTAKILDAREARDLNGGAWPESVPGIEVSRCPEARFAYSAGSGAGMSITFDRALKFEDRPGKITLPLRFTSGAPAGEKKAEDLAEASLKRRANRARR